MNTSLTTFDGYPRADIDVAQIRTTRARIIILKNDHKEIMKRLEVAVQEQFAANKAGEAASTAQSTSAGGETESSAENASTSAPVIEPPFAKINAVIPNSPAEQAGLKAGDKVTRIGNINYTNHERLSKVAREVQQNENVS